MQQHDGSNDGSERESIEVQGARVLVADDDAAMRELVTSTLAEHGYDVFEAESGEELLWATRSMVQSAWPWDGFDILVTDIRMPGLSGLDVLRELRASRFDGPVVLMTAFPDASVVAEAARLHAALLPKPFSLASLSRLVLSLFQRSAARLDPVAAPAS